MRVWQLGLSGVLKSEARGVTRGLRGKRFAAALVACQMALAVVLLSGSGILVRSLWNVVKAQTGVRDAQNVLVALIHLPSEKYSGAARQIAYFDDLETKLRTIPEVQSASVSRSIPVGSGDLEAFEIEGQAAERYDQAAQFVSAGSGYLRVMGAPAIAGREFNDQDRPSAPPVAMVNQSFADRFWPGQPSLGRRIRAKGRSNSGEWLTVVGVAPNVMQGDPIRQVFKPVIYVPFRQSPAGTAFLFVRTAVSPDSIAAAVRAAIQNSDPDAALEELTTLQATFGFDRDRMDLEHAEMGKHAAVAPVFAVIALLLAAVGLYAVIAHSVGQRTKEIGVRMAIGATAGHIRRMILRDGLLPVAIGTVVGLTSSLAMNRILQSQLVGVLPYDPATLSAAPALLALVALLACQIPARRATQVDPAVALRHD